jgi:hypothetical protein
VETPNPVAVLEQRIVFLKSIEEVAKLCNWDTRDIKTLNRHVHERLVEIDNIRYDLIELSVEEKEEYGEERANYVWQSLMEQLRKDLSLILGVKIRYV